MIVLGPGLFARPAAGLPPVAGVALIVVVGVSSLVFGVPLAVNGFRMGVELRNGVVVVRGLTGTVRIPEVAVIGVDVPGPALRWRSPDGTVRRTGITAFGTPVEALRFVGEHNERTMREIEKALLGR